MLEYNFSQLNCYRIDKFPFHLTLFLVEILLSLPTPLVFILLVNWPPAPLPGKHMKQKITTTP